MNEHADCTLFIPTNDALAPMIESGNPAPYRFWEDLILDHIVSNHVQATKYMEPTAKAGLVTLAGTEVDMDYCAGQYTVTCADRFADFTAKITTKDQLACYGVAHVINSILKSVEQVCSQTRVNYWCIFHVCETQQIKRNQRQKPNGSVFASHLLVPFSHCVAI